MNTFSSQDPSGRSSRCRKDMERLARELGPEDGSDPKEFFAERESGRGASLRKTRALCGQVRDALNFALCELEDPLLQLLLVHDVVPAPDSSRLRAVFLLPREFELSVAEVTRRLDRLTGSFRQAVAGSISRRKVPLLVFDVLREEGGEAPR